MFSICSRFFEENVLDFCSLFLGSKFITLLTLRQSFLTVPDLFIPIKLFPEGDFAITNSFSFKLASSIFRFCVRPSCFYSVSRRSRPLRLLASSVSERLLGECANIGMAQTEAWFNLPTPAPAMPLWWCVVSGSGRTTVVLRECFLVFRF